MTTTQTNASGGAPKRTADEIRKANEAKIKAAREKDAAEKAARKAAAGGKPGAKVDAVKPTITLPSPAEVRKIKQEAKKPAEDANLLSVSDVARECNLDPKRARARLRSARGKATEGRWEKVRRDSAEHKELVVMFTAEPPAKIGKTTLDVKVDELKEAVKIAEEKADAVAESVARHTHDDEDDESDEE